MGSLEHFQSTLASSNGILLFIRGLFLCGCGQKFSTLNDVQGHLEAEHQKQKYDEEVEEDIKAVFEENFTFPSNENDVKVEPNNDLKKNEKNLEGSQVITVTLPSSFTCVCLNEHDLGAFSGLTKCFICHEDCLDLEFLNKHLATKHRVSQVLIGQNILFEKPPSMTPLPPAFFCPMVKCKYHIAESHQKSHFKTFKLLKQHYKKVHAAKTLTCPTCPAKFGSSGYLELHMRTCGKSFSCSSCKATFPVLESLQTHARRKGHPLPATYRPRTHNSSLPSLGLPRPSATGSLPLLAPRPSALHIQAAIALSELEEKRLGDIDPCDIGVQTQPVESSARTKEGSKRSSCSPGRASTTLSYRKKQEAETQTKEHRRKCSTVSSQVQTLGEFTVRTKRRLEEAADLASQGSQCVLSPAKAARVEDKVCQAVGDAPNLGFSLSVDIPDLEALWPLTQLTSGTQTSPRAPQLPPARTLSIDSDQDPAEKVNNNNNEVGTSLADQGRQFSTETQTEFDLFLDSIGVLNTNGNSSSNNIEASTSSMETQTGQGGEEEDFLLFANNCTQTELERLFSPSAPSAATNETQTRLTGFQEPAAAANTFLNTEDMYSHIETQTCDLQDLLS